MVAAEAVNRMLVAASRDYIAEAELRGDTSVPRCLTKARCGMSLIGTKRIFQIR
jgi:hypothetical protein